MVATLPRARMHGRLYTSFYSFAHLSCSLAVRQRGCLSPVLMQARMVHAFSNVLAMVRSEGCTPVDLLPSTLAGQCSSCGAVAALR